MRGILLRLYLLCLLGMGQAAGWCAHTMLQEAAGCGAAKPLVASPCVPQAQPQLCCRLCRVNSHVGPCSTTNPDMRVHS